MEFNATFLVSIISFLVFMKLMNAIFYIPLTNIIEEREEIVNKNHEHSFLTRQKADKLLADKDERLVDTAKKSRQILIDKTNEANSDYKTRVTEAKKESDIRAEQLKKELANSEKEAKTILDTQIEDLAQTIVNKVLQGGQNG